VRLLTALAVGLLLAAAVPAAAANAPPLVDAGLDQSTTVGTTVYLDGGDTGDPDGNVTGYSWSIETPSGNTVTPDCPSCVRTEFRPTATGQYNVTLTATDDDGASAQDTLYLTVETVARPTVELTGPTVVQAGETASFTADVTADNATLDSLTWVVDGRVADRSSLSGESATPTITRTFDGDANHTVEAVVYDSRGRRANASQALRVLRVGAPSGNATTTGGGGGSGDIRCPDSTSWWVNGHFIGCTKGGTDTTYSYGGETVVVDTNGEAGIQLHLNPEGLPAKVYDIGENGLVDLDNFETEGGTFKTDELTDEFVEKKKEERRNEERDTAPNPKSSSDSGSDRHTHPDHTDTDFGYDPPTDTDSGDDREDVVEDEEELQEETETEVDVDNNGNTVDTGDGGGPSIDSGTDNTDPPSHTAGDRSGGDPTDSTGSCYSCGGGSDDDDSDDKTAMEEWMDRVM